MMKCYYCGKGIGFNDYNGGYPHYTDKGDTGHPNKCEKSPDNWCTPTKNVCGSITKLKDVGDDEHRTYKSDMTADEWWDSNGSEHTIMAQETSGRPETGYTTTNPKIFDGPTNSSTNPLPTKKEEVKVIQKCDPVEIKKSLDRVDLLVKAGVDFVAMPVRNEGDKIQLIYDSMAIVLEIMEERNKEKTK